MTIVFTKKPTKKLIFKKKPVIEVKPTKGKKKYA